ncbi:MAG: CRISPR-associated endonuclease Cas2 [Deltaproteobacteria bacterium]|nr:CRISPR-associated endonuclease Cas2 [Deltaproteobacteria bacterium]
MITAVAYDIIDNRRRQRLSKLLGQYGQRVQKSVFEMDLEDKQLPSLIRKIEKSIDLSEDSVRIYRLPADAIQLSLWLGRKVEVSEKGYYIF